MNAKEISALMDKFSRSNLNEFRVANGNSSVYFSKLNQPGAVGQTVSAQSNSHPVLPAVTHSNAKPNVPTAKPAAEKLSQPKKKPATIKAPLVGIVYFAPNPKKPAFVKTGAHVNKGDTICQIEAMKVLNDVKAPKSGKIVKRLVKNGTMVQYHQPIFQIKAD